MMRPLLFWLLFALFAEATTLRQLIDSALAKHPSLQAIEERIAASDYALKRAKNFDNPLLGLSVNNLRLDDFTNRSLEPMQTQAVTITQKFPWFGKRDAKEAIEAAKKAMLFATKEAAEAVLVSRIRQTAYDLWKIDRLIDLTKKTMALTRQNVDLYEAYTASGESGKAHMGIMSAELVLTRLRVTLAKLRAERSKRLALLSYLAFQKIDDLRIDLPQKALPSLDRLIKRIDRSPDLQTRIAQKAIVDKRLAFDKLRTAIDPVVKVGYYHRESYEDYLSVGVGFALPIYGTERSIVEERRARLLARQSEVIDTRQKLLAELEKLHAKARSASEVARLIEKESLPKIDHMFDLIRSDIAAGGDLYKFVDLVEQKLNLQAQMIEAKADYYRTVAQIDATLGEKR
ncbi:TolC family protein [Hydrogenimonas urashimensis]|uniref:TolC family protein n=1 Tax=Hydrogenimonas urashimensis TaxID=2740515 RepID=UPI001915D909|nr:TolC family protein [Hydrogenimonas urashimensis]